MDIESYPERKTLEVEYSKKHPRYRTVMMELWQDVQATLEAIDIHATIKSRVKSFESYYTKLLKRLEERRNNGGIEPIHDIVALRVVCPFLEDIAGVEEKLRSVYRIRDVEHKGETHTVGEFGYNCTHLVLAIPEHIRDRVPHLDIETAEVQIRTILQDAWSEVEHELIYKSRIAPLDTPLRRKLAAINATLSLSDITFQEIRDYQRRLQKELAGRRRSFSAEQTGRAAQSRISQKVSHDEEMGSREVADSTGKVIRSLDDLLVEALHAHNRENYTTAIELYSRILQSSIEPPLRAIVLMHRGIAQFCRTRYQQARQDFTEATRCEPDNGKAFYHLGTVNRVLGDYVAAECHLRRSVELDPYRLEALVELAKVYFATGKYSAMDEYCTKALRLSPGLPEALELRAMARDGKE